VAMAKKIAAQPEGEEPDAEAEQARDRRAARDLQDERRLEPFETCSTAAYAPTPKKCRRAEVHVAGVAAEDVPRGSRAPRRSAPCSRRRRNTR